MSSLDGRDPIEEVQKVIDKDGYCWFGKYGRPIGIDCFSKSCSSNIIIANKDASGYTLYTFKRLEAQRFRPEDGCYPKYYHEFLGRIGTWIKLENAPHANFKTSDLIIHSTKSSLISAFKGSMSSHFICESRSITV